MDGLSAKRHQAEDDAIRMIQRYEHMLLRFCTRILQDRGMAQDAVQETFLKAHLKRKSFRGAHAHSEKAWLMQIAANTCKDQRRSRWYRIVDGRTDIELLNRPVFEDEEVLLLRWAVTALPEPYRVLVVMHYYQDMTTHEIAYAIRQSPSTVYRKLEQAREMLRRLLQ